MEKIIGVQFKHTNRIYYFSPKEEKLKKGDKVVVETVRGVEIGTVMIEEKELEKNVQWEIKPIIRKCRDEEIEENLNKAEEKKEALRLCQEKIEENNLDMKLIDVEFGVGNSKIIFYFTAEGRVDFRDLVKSLASVFKMRIELRQIGVRDEAKMLGGIGSCGRSLCCSNWLSDFQPVSIKMAKTQNLSLNPTKISGICGRLMCCLNYENDNYIDARRGMPELHEEVLCPDGKGIVTDVRVLENIIKVKIETKDKDKTDYEIKSYGKEEIKLLRKRKCCCDKGDEEIPEEVIELLKD